MESNGEPDQDAFPSRADGEVAPPSWPSLTAAFARRHWLFLPLFIAGALLRSLTLLAYRPALFNSEEYLVASEHLLPEKVHPFGYAVLLRSLPLEHGLAIVPAVQHLLGLGVAIVLYGLLLRLGVPTWLAALSAAPLLLDAYQLGIEQYITSETFFELLLVGGCAAILWGPSAPTVLVGAAGLLFAAASLTRPIGLLAFVPAVLTVIFLRVGLARVLVLVMVFALPLVGYASWYRSIHGQFAIAGSAGGFLYGRVAGFADCSRFDTPDYERVLCPSEPVGERLPVNELLWSSRFSPLSRIRPPAEMTRDKVAADFVERTLVHQPEDFARAVGSDVLRAFAPTRGLAPGEYGEPPWQFHRSLPTFFRGSVCSPESFRQIRDDLTILGEEVANRRVAGCARRRAKMTTTIRMYGDEPSNNSSLVSFLRGYQRVGYAPGPLMGACLVAGIAAALGIGRARSSGLRSAAFLFSGVATVVCLGGLLITIFSWRYQLPQLALLPAAGALGITALLGLSKGSTAASQGGAGEPRESLAPAGGRA